MRQNAATKYFAQNGARAAKYPRENAGQNEIANRSRFALRERSDRSAETEAICGEPASISAERALRFALRSRPDFRRRRRLRGSAGHRRASVGQDVRGRGDGKGGVHETCGYFDFENGSSAPLCVRMRRSERRLRFTRRIGIPVDRCPAVWPELNSGTSGGRAGRGRYRVGRKVAS